MGFILSVLIIGALLAAIFGRGVAQLFVMSTATIISVVVIYVAVLVVSGLIYMQFHPQPTPTSTRTRDIYSYMDRPAANQPVGATPATTPTPSAPTPVASRPAPATNTAPPQYAALEPPPLPNSSSQPTAPAVPKPFDNVRSPFEATATNAPGPTMGITTAPADPQFSAQFSMRPGFGVRVVSVAPGGPAEQGGLQPGDFIQAMDDDPITADHTLNDYEARKGVGQPIRLSVEHNDGGRWVHEWVKVTPR